MSRPSRTTSPGATPPGLDTPPVVPARSRWSRAALVAALAVSLSGGAVLTASSASAAVPSFPDNVVVFPNRDFVTIEGYQDHIGETATIEVKRPGVGIVGSAQGVVEEGDVAFEINHPGGYCWGAGTGLNITPDIQPGDAVSIRFGNTEAGETIAQDAFVDADAAITTTTLNGDTVLVKGHIGADVIKDNTEQRIVEPALTDTDVARRDVRAVPGPLTRAPKGGYSSMLEFDDEKRTFLATYIFDDPNTAEIAANAGLGERLLSWQLTDADANRQGLTIAEFGEPGGPGMGGCPNGPLQSGPPAPTNISAAKVSGGDIKVNWTPAQAIPGTPAITGYRVTALAQTSTNNQQVEIGRRITGQGATGTTITGLASGETYDIEVVSMSSVGQTFPAAHAIPETDGTAPTVASSPNGGTFAVAQNVTLTTNDPVADIYFTTDGSDPVQVDSPSPLATLYTAPIAILETTTLRFAAIDPSGNVSDVGERTFTITNQPTPDAPTFGTPVIGNGQITLSWTSNDPSVDMYGVHVYDADGGDIGGVRETTSTSLTVDSLTEAVPYFFTVQARNGNGYGPESAKLGPLSPQGSVVANAGPDQSGVARNSTVTLNGSGSSAGATYQWTQLATGTGNPIAANDPDKVTLTGATGRNASFVLPFYRYPMSAQPLTFQLAVTLGGATRTDAVVITPSSDRVTIGTAKWKTGDFRATGTSSTVGGTITIRSAPNAAGQVTVYGTATVTAAAAPETGGVWDFRLRAGVPTTNPGRIFADSNRGGTAGPFTVPNG
jgi:hypothetical protein